MLTVVLCAAFICYSVGLHLFILNNTHIWCFNNNNNYYYYYYLLNHLFSSPYCRQRKAEEAVANSLHTARSWNS